MFPHDILPIWKCVMSDSSSNEFDVSKLRASQQPRRASQLTELLEKRKAKRERSRAARRIDQVELVDDDDEEQAQPGEDVDGTNQRVVNDDEEEDDDDDDDENARSESIDAAKRQDEARPSENRVTNAFRLLLSTTKRCEYEFDLLPAAVPRSFKETFLDLFDTYLKKRTSFEEHYPEHLLVLQQDSNWRNVSRLLSYSNTFFGNYHEVFLNNVVQPGARAVVVVI
jgi:hypothetical protein